MQSLVKGMIRPWQKGSIFRWRREVAFHRKFVLVKSGKSGVGPGEEVGDRIFTKESY